MKRFLLLVGLLFIPVTASAQALSPWVQGVLDAASAGIATANSRTATSCDVEQLRGDVDQNLTRERVALSDIISATDEAERRGENTVCYESDRRLLIEKMRLVLETLSLATKSCKTDSARVLRDVYVYLAEAYTSFLKGALDPTYQDARLQTPQAFESAALWEQTENSSSSTSSLAGAFPLCPYTSDYAVHVFARIPQSSIGTNATVPSGIRSFGCDLSVISTLPSDMQGELEPLKKLLKEAEDFAKATFGGFIDLSQVDHAEQTGCLKPKIPLLASEAPRSVADELLAFPNYFDLFDNSADHTIASRSALDPTPAQTLPVWSIFRAVTSPFRTLPDAVGIIRSFADLKSDQGETRPMPNGLPKDNDYFWSGLAGERSISAELGFISGDIDREAGLLDAMGRDAYERVRNATEPLHTAMRSLATVVEEYLPKEYIPDLTYFLLRSCVDGHCQKTLEAVAQRTFNQYCHPYLSGRYKEDDVPEKCFCKGEYANEEFCRGKLSEPQEVPKFECAKPQENEE